MSKIFNQTFDRATQRRLAFANVPALPDLNAGWLAQQCGYDLARDGKPTAQTFVAAIKAWQARMPTLPADAYSLDIETVADDPIEKPEYYLKLVEGVRKAIQGIELSLYGVAPFRSGDYARDCAEDQRIAHDGWTQADGLDWAKACWQRDGAWQKQVYTDFCAYLSVVPKAWGDMTKAANSGIDDQRLQAMWNDYCLRAISRRVALYRAASNGAPVCITVCPRYQPSGATMSQTVQEHYGGAILSIHPEWIAVWGWQRDSKRLFSALGVKQAAPTTAGIAAPG